MIIESWPWPCDEWPPRDLPKLEAAQWMVDTHNAVLDSLNDLVDKAGSVTGAARLAIDELGARGDITAGDIRRLNVMLDVFESGADVEAGLEQLDQLNAESREDEDVTVTALAILAIASSGIRRAVTNSKADAFWAGEADAFGVIYGTFVLPGPGSLAAGVAASYVAEHIHVDVTVKWR